MWGTYQQQPLIGMHVLLLLGVGFVEGCLGNGVFGFIPPPHTRIRMHTDIYTRIYTHPHPHTQAYPHVYTRTLN